MMRNIRLKMSYDGSRYAGFQIQPDCETIQSKVQAAIRAVTGETVTISGSGRTDAGVHARGQVVNFTTSSSIPAGRWCQALNSHLPRDIVIWSAEDVPESFHARKSAKLKTYCYTINGNRYPDVMHRHMELHHPAALDVKAMKTAIACLIGEHDFTSFSSVRSDKQSRVRTLYSVHLEVEQVPGMESAPGVGRIRLFITGNGFLYNMVRIIVGTMIHVGEGKLAPQEMQRILEARDRSQAGPTAKPSGLMLWDVQYDPES